MNILELDFFGAGDVFFFCARKMQNHIHIALFRKLVVSIIQTYRPWTPRRTSGRIVNKKI